MVHAINPHGFAWLRRVTEENVDLNRNFVDHGGPHPANDAYDALHPALCPERWGCRLARRKMARAIEDYVDRNGAFALTGRRHARPVSASGRHFLRRQNADLVEFDIPRHSRQACDGRAPCRFCRPAHRARCLRRCEMIGGAGPSTPGGRRMRDWYGDIVTSPSTGTSSSAPLVGRHRAFGTRSRQGCGRDQRDSGVRHLSGARGPARPSWRITGSTPTGTSTARSAARSRRISASGCSPTRTTGRTGFLTKGVEILNRTLAGLGDA